MKQKWKRPLALLLSVAMMFSLSGTPVYAADVEMGASAVCPHHVHDETCGYSEGSSCTFDPSDCELCNPTDSGEPEGPAECICETLCTEGVGNLNCPVCTQDIAACQGEAPAECTCETLCTADSVNPDCPVCSAEGADLTACAGTVEEGDAAPQTVTAWAVEEGVQYLYYNPENGQMETGTYSGQYTTTSLGYGTTLGSAGTETWYVADGNGSSMGTTIPVYGDVRLILAAGSNISLAGSSLNITDGSSLTIYGQDSSSGRLSLTPDSSPITLGSGSSLTIHGGSLTLQTMSATGISVGSGTLTIYGGSVSTRSNPGISVSSGGTLNIYGGTLTSQDIYGSTGSITGEADSSININGNAVITGNISGADNDDSWNAIINSTVYGTVTLPDSLKTGLNRYLTVPDGAELILPNGTSIPTSGTITVESGGTLTVEEGSTVYNNSTITVNEGGTFSGGGTLVNQSNGTFSSDGDTSGVTILYEPTVTVTSQSNKDTNVADKNE